MLFGVVKLRDGLNCGSILEFAPCREVSAMAMPQFSLCRLFVALTLFSVGLAIVLPGLPFELYEHYIDGSLDSILQYVGIALLCAGVILPFARSSTAVALGLVAPILAVQLFSAIVVIHRLWIYVPNDRVACPEWTDVNFNGENEGSIMQRINSNSIPILFASRSYCMACMIPLFFMVAARGEEDATAPPVEPPSTTTVRSREFVARLHDGGQLKFLLTDDQIELETRYGKLKIACEDIRRIDFALRLSDTIRQRIDKSLADLTSSREEVREAAEKELLSLGLLAHAALAEAAKDEESIRGRQAARILEALEKQFDGEEPPPCDADVIHTVDSTISGRLVQPAIQVRSAQFGELSLKIVDARDLRSAELLAEERRQEPSDALPDPGQLTSFHHQAGKTLRFRVTGMAGGTVWGTNVYTTDSQLCAAAVHAGALRLGETGVVAVRIIPSPPSFVGSNQNGIQSHQYGPYSMAYEIVKPRSRRR